MINFRELVSWTFPVLDLPKPFRGILGFPCPFYTFDSSDELYRVELGVWGGDMLFTRWVFGLFR